MGFAKFLSPRQIKLARGTARNFKLEPAAAGMAKFSFTLEGLRFAGISKAQLNLSGFSLISFNSF